MDRIRDIYPPGSPFAILPRLVRSTVAGPGGCVIWTGLRDRDNYGHIKVKGKTLRVHRVSYALMVDEIPQGMQLDHRCHTEDPQCPGGRACLHRRCLNPHHLDLVTSRQNTLRSAHAISAIHATKTHCPQGHPYDAANTYVCPQGKRSCRTCTRDRGRAYRERIRTAVAQ